MLANIKNNISSMLMQGFFTHAGVVYTSSQILKPNIYRKPVLTCENPVNNKICLFSIPIQILENMIIFRALQTIFFGLKMLFSNSHILTHNPQGCAR